MAMNLLSPAEDLHRRLMQAERTLEEYRKSLDAAERQMRYEASVVKLYNEALERIAASRPTDTRTIHSKLCPGIAREALQAASNLKR